MVHAGIILIMKYLRVYSELQAQTQVEEAHHAFYGHLATPFSVQAVTLRLPLLIFMVETSYRNESK